MKPPTKFELMRNNRHRAEVMGREFGWTPITQLTEQDMLAVPTMEIDGVKYRELGRDTCAGCICEYRKSGCAQFNANAMESFGGFCGERNVIYVKAE